jgi:hypothetical protein
MTKNQIWGLALGAVVAAGVAYYVLTKLGQCSGAECQITVEVKDCASGKFDVMPETAKIKVPKHIKWTIATSGYVFKANGIQISGTDFTVANDAGQGQGPDTNKWRIHDKDLVADTYPYTVAIKSTSGAACGPNDPFIVNE